MKNIAKTTAIVLTAFLSAFPAFALSCSERNAYCVGSDPAHNRGATPAQCRAAFVQCKRDCKAGKKFYVGAVTGRVLPVDSCE